MTNVSSSPSACEKLKLHRQRRQAKEGLVGREELARMRLEHHGAGALAQFLGKIAGAAEHRLMAAMDAIEIADGEHCAFCLRRHIPPTGDDIHPSFLDERAIACATCALFATFMSYAPRRGTIIRASPSNTLLPLTVACMASTALPFSGSRLVILPVATTSSPISTGARNLRLCER